MCLNSKECDLIIHTTIVYVWGAFFKFQGKFNFTINHPTIVVGHEHVWNHQKASLVFGGGWHP